MNNYKLWPNTSEVTTIASGTGIDITGTVTPIINIENTTVVAGSYTNANFVGILKDDLPQQLQWLKV